MSKDDSHEYDNLQPINERHTISVDEAVLMLLGIRADLTPREDISIFAADILLDIQGKANAGLSNAKIELWKCHNDGGDKQDERGLKEKISEQETALKKAQNLSEVGGNYLRSLKTEIANTRSNVESIIVVDEDVSRVKGYANITLSSFRKWSRKELGVDIDNPDAPIQHQLREDSLQTIKEKNSSITLYILAEALADLIDEARENDLIEKDLYDKGKTFKINSNGELNVAALVRYVLSNTKQVEGQKERSLKERITQAMKLTSREMLESSIKSGGNDLAKHNFEKPPYPEDS
jgi:hypothetical protein